MKKSIISLVILVIVVGVLCIYRKPIVDSFRSDLSQWVTQEGKHYLLDKEGNPRTGWVDYEGNRYYFDETGAMYCGWLEKDGETFYLDAAGRAYHGWLSMYGNRYYLDSNGKLCTGWLELEDARYFLDEADGHLYTGWLEKDGQSYYLDETLGHAATGWIQTPEGSFYMKPDGAMATGLTRAEGELYYFDDNGVPMGGWIEDEAGMHYFGDDGRPCTGWLEYEGETYYLLSEGIPAVGRLVVEDRTYFFTSAGKEFMLVNTWNPLPEDFKLTPEQHLGVFLDPACLEALEQMLAACTEAGFNPRVQNGYCSVQEQEANLQHTLYYYLSLTKETEDPEVKEKLYSYAEAYAIATSLVEAPRATEHHLGLAFDIVDSSYRTLNNRQTQMPIHQWLKDNCWKYGFIQRYPEGSEEITGSLCKQWHYRYVGLELAAEIHELGDIPLETYIDNLTNDGTTCGGKAPADE